MGRTTKRNILRNDAGRGAARLASYVLAMSLCASSRASAALPVLVELFDPQGNPITGEPLPVKGYEKAITGFYFLHEWVAVFDPRTGIGRPPELVALDLTLPVGPHSPVLWKHLAMGSTLKKAVFHFVHLSRDGTRQDFYRLTITDLNIVGIRSALRDLQSPANVSREVEETVSLIYRNSSHEAFMVEQLLYLPGDTTGDRKFDISDPILLLGFLFLGSAVRCPLSGDMNADRKLDVSDPISMLNFLFLGGRPPPSPFPSCGAVPPGQAIPCDATACDGAA